ncbi:DUF2946 family protein [Variovorax boronicumulans]|uniref:DUF2946 family protein n=1 Tax=Variovorax boronicumulans TaxID=436515 RepID=UPI0024741B7B|nr:DUF2946 family protein [Variovorax boronicumulans]
MPLRLLGFQRLLRLLLLAVFFNAAIGMPLHEAGHLRQAADGLTQAAAFEGCANAADPAGEEEAHGVCEWCLAYAHHAPAPAPQPASFEVRQSAAMPRAPPVAVFVPNPLRWPFASRDPPLAST